MTSKKKWLTTREELRDEYAATHPEKCIYVKDDYKGKWQPHSYHPEAQRPKRKDDPCQGTCLTLKSTNSYQRGRCKKETYCQRQPCVICKETLPLYILTHCDGMCPNCATEYRSWSDHDLPFRAKGYCFGCKMKLCQTVDGGVMSHEWPKDKYHKKCWLQWWG